MMRIMVGMIFLLLVACSEKPKVSEDKFTEDSSISSVVESKEELINAGNLAFMQGQFNEAIQYYEKGLKENKATAYYNIGVAHYLMNDIDAAEENFRLAIDEDPSFDEAIMNLVAVLAEQEKSIEAEKYISKLVNKKKTARVFVDMANLSLKNGSTAKASFYYDKAFDIDNKSEFILSNYANFLISLGEVDAGEKMLNNISDKDFNVRYNLAYVSTLKGDVAAAYDNATFAKNMQNGTEEGTHKLADLFATLRKFPDEADVIRKLIAWNPNKSNRIRLVYSYLRGWNLNAAYDEASLLVSDYPKDSEAIVARYRTMVALGDITAAGDYLKKAFAENRNDFLLYHAVRHMCLYERRLDDAYKLIKMAKNTPYMDLARVAYYISNNELPKAWTFLDKLPESLSNDYYMYKSFLLFKQKKNREAEKVASMMDDTRPEYFWYQFVLAWDLQKPDRINELLDLYKEDYIIAARVPTMKYMLNPVVEDLSFTYKFDLTGKDIASKLLYPFFIEPDEVYPFIVLGYKLLKDNEKSPALGELNRSLEFSKAVQLNNDGVKSLLNYNYAAALAYFQEAGKVMSHNPFQHYNQGLLFYIGGELQAAEKSFNEAIRLNKYLAPAYVGMGLIREKQGEHSDALIYFKSAIENADLYMAEIKDSPQSNPMVPMISKAKYLAYLALEDYSSTVSTAEKDKGKDNFITGMLAIGSYMTKGDHTLLSPLEDTQFYNSKNLKYLMDLHRLPVSELKEMPTKDKSTAMSAKYVLANRAKMLTEVNIENYLKDKPVLVDLINLSIVLKDKEKGLHYLRMISLIDSSYPPQYKSSLYYFMWADDYVNAEASYVTLERLKYVDRDVLYYYMLYFLINNNPTRLEAAMEQFAKSYPTDYRGRMINMMKYVEERNIKQFIQSMGALMQEQPYLFNKMPLEIDIERF